MRSPFWLIFYIFISIFIQNSIETKVTIDCEIQIVYSHESHLISRVDYSYLVLCWVFFLLNFCPGTHLHSHSNHLKILWRIHSIYSNQHFCWMIEPSVLQLRLQFDGSHLVFFCVECLAIVDQKHWQSFSVALQDRLNHCVSVINRRLPKA